VPIHLGDGHPIDADACVSDATTDLQTESADAK
jgi:hypothetical protein